MKHKLSVLKDILSKDIIYDVTRRVKICCCNVISYISSLFRDK